MIKIYYETDVVELYRQQLDLIKDQEILDAHIKRWKVLFSIPDHCEYEKYKKAREELKTLQELPNEDQQMVLHIIIPVEILKISCLATEFVAPTGVAFLQFFNHPEPMWIN